MKRICVLSLACVALLSGCAAKLGMKSITMDKTSANIGDSVTLTVVLKGSAKQVSRVTATVRDAPDYSFSLNDNGKYGDEKAGDNIWTYTIIVPYEADPGDYTLDISVRDKDGKELVVEGNERRTTGKSGTVVVTVK